MLVTALAVLPRPVPAGLLNAWDPLAAVKSNSWFCAEVALVCWSIYLSYRYADQILNRLGPSGINVLLRLSAFILLCLGVQILLNGLRVVLGTPAA